MTDSIARIKSRAATQARLDLRGVKATRTGKTKRGKLKCTAGNVQCGNRCIPQAWDCRLEGKGTNSELKAASFDPLGGVASVERGFKTIAKNPTSVQSWDRGRNSIVRGFVKATPGDNLEKKKQLKRRLQKYGNQIGAVVLTGVAVVGAHQSAKRLSRSYREGTGRKIDMAAFGAVDAVLDRTPFVGRSRQQTRNTAAGVSGGMAGAVGYQFRKQGIENRSMVNTGRVGPLSYPPGGLKVQGAGVYNPQNELKKRVQLGEDAYKRVLAKKPIRDFGSKPGSKALQVDKDNWLKKSEKFKNDTKNWQTQLDDASSKRVGFDAWVKESTQKLYEAKSGTTGKSAYSDDAANRFLTRQFGLNASSVFQRGAGVDTGVLNQTQRNDIVVAELGERLRGWSRDLEADMTLKRISKDSNGNFDRNEVMKYIDSSVLPKMNFNQRGFTASQQNNARIKARSLAKDLLIKRKGVNLDYGTVAGNMRRETVSRYNEYFNEVAQGMNIPAAAKNSPFGDGQVGLARFVSRLTTTGGGKVNPIKSRDQASLILKDYYTRNVVGDTEGSFTASENLVMRVAQQINGGNAAPDKNTAYSIVRESGIKSLRSPSEVGSLAKPQKKPTERRGVKTGLERQRDQSVLARKIMQREGFTGDYAAALKQARNELNGRKRTDNEDFIPIRVGNHLQTREDLRGKPCGASHIPKAHDCTKGKGKEAPPESSTKTGGISGKKIAAAVLVGSVGAIAVAAASDAYQLNSGLGMPDTLTVRSAVKPHLNGGKGSDPVVMQAAMGRYYDKQIKEQGWKVGDLVYAKTKNEPVSHFGIYMGKTKTGAHSFATMGVDGLNGKQGGIDVLEAGAGARRKTGLLYAKAPSNKQPNVRYSPEEIANRVSRLQGKKLDYDTFDANCESWANMIVSGKSRSTQSQRLTLVGKTAIRAVYKSLESVSALDEDYPKQVRSGDRIQKVASWLDKANPRGNDFGYQAMVQRDSKYRKDAADPEYLGLIDPSSVIKERMSDIEAVA